MQKPLALCITALLLLAGCLGTADVEDVVEDVLEVVGCGDETALNYVANVTNATNDLCVHEASLETAILRFITLIEDGPEAAMITIDTTVGFSMEMSEVYIDMESCYEWEYWNPEQVDESQPYNGCPDVVEVSIHYMETTVMSPTGFKSTMEHTIDGVTESSEIIISGNEVQFHIKNSTEDYTVKMKHADTFEDAMEMMMSDDDDMGSDDEDMGSGDDEMVCYDMSTHMILYEYYDQMTCEGDGYMWVPASSGPSDDMDDAGEMADFGEVDVNDYTHYYDPLSATITGFAPDETGYTFSGTLNIESAPFSYLEIHTDSNFKVLGFTMEDTEEEDNWVEFMMIDSGDTSTDDTITLSALPYILLDMSEDGDGEGDGDSGDGTYWEPYYGGYCEWEGNPDDDERWSCKEDESDSDWENWWYYCELHEGDWFCTDDYGQSSEYENSADNDRYTNGYDGGDDGGSDDEFMCDNGETIPWDWVNDGYPDCEDGSDEWDDGPEEEEIATYYCTPFVAQNSAGFSIFNNSSLDFSLCGMEATDEMYEFDNSSFTMPTNLIWEDCWMEDNETVCENGEIYFDLNTTMLWETTHENNYTDCDGDYDNNTSMCTEWIGNITDADGSAFLIAQDFGEVLIMYQYDEATQSGLVISVESDDDDFDPEMWFSMFDADEDGEVTASEWADMMNQSGEGMTEEDWNGLLMMIEMYDEDNSSGLNLSEFVNMMENMDDMGDDGDYDDEWSLDREMQDCDSDGDELVSYAELEACINEDLINDGFDYMNASDIGAPEAFDMMDMDSDGMLNESEFNFLNALLSNSYDDDDDDDDMDPEMMFNMLDGNGDGEVTASEWSDFSNSTDEPMTEDDFNFLAGMMDNYDDDDSGGLDYDEFITFMNEMENMEDGDGEDMKMYMVFGVLEYGGDLDDYRVELAMCVGTSFADIACTDSVYSVALSEIMVTSEEAAMMAMMTEAIVFVDSDESGTLTTGDFVMVNNATLEADGEWNFARLYSSEAGAYSDENPMMSMLPGFTGFIATIGLLGAALIRRE